MATSVKVGGNWSSLSGVSAKVSGNWKTVNAAYVKVAGEWKQWFSAFITDNFNRSTSGTLGTSSSGAAWTTQRGNWYANGGAAQSDDSASNYSHASVGWGPASITASTSVTGGTGVTFWVSDANSWWAAISYNTATSYSYGINPYSCNCSNCQTCSTTQSVTQTVLVGYTSNTYNCACGQVCGQCPGGYTYNLCSQFRGYCHQGPCTRGYPASIAEPSCTTSYTCSCGDGGQPIYSTTTTTQTVYYECNCSCQTCYSGTASGTTYNYYLRLLKSESGTVSVATSDIDIGSQAAAISVVVNGNAITAKAYSDTGMGSQLGSTLSYTATSPVKGQSVGIIKAPSDYNQGSTVDNFSVNL
jgi:hypothetical protein